MATLIPVRLSDQTTIYIEGSESAPAPGKTTIQEASALDAAEKALDTGQQLSESVKSFCAVIVKSMSELAAKPSKVSLEFGLNISLEGNVYVVKTTGEASIRITAEWSS